MRLLRCKPDSDGDFELITFDTDRLPPYAILSHTWIEGEEVTYPELVAGTGKNKTGYAKICFCGRRAMADGLEYFWVDTCCINRSTSDELSTAINSMFCWYQRASKCYVYLSDVGIPDEAVNIAVDVQTLKLTWEDAFRRSRWFTRGWTLQELLAPATVEFFSKEGKKMGSKTLLEQEIHEITTIPIAAIRGEPLAQFSVEERLAWAARRKTTLKEDKVYCLLGIFGVFLSLIYGEGEAYATLRLREEIQKRQDANIDQGSIRNPFPMWRNLGGSFSGTPAVISCAPERTDVFVRGPDNAVFHKWQNADGTPWGPAEMSYESLGGVIYGDVTAASWGPNRIDIFGRGTDNACWHKSWNGNVWSDWETLKGGIIGDICAVSRGVNRLDLFVRGMDNAVYHKAWNGAAWLPDKLGWNYLGGRILGSPKAVCWGSNRIDVFVRGTDNAIHQKTWNGSVWEPSVTDWKSLGGAVMDDITPVSWGANRLDLIAQGMDNAVYQKTWNGSAWEPSGTVWNSLGGTTVSRPSAVAWGGNKIAIAIQGQDNGVWTRYWNGSAWMNWEPLGGIIISDAPVVNPRGGKGMAIFVRGANASLYTFS